MEQRLIDADALKKRVSELIVPDWTRTLIRSWLDSEPTVDAVPVVRCKDCAYWDRGTIRMIAGNPELIGAICDKYHENGISEDVWTAADHYCADGERRTE